MTTVQYHKQCNPRRVAVIGAGLAGLVTIKSCIEEGLEVQAFETSDRLGGNWQFKEEGVSVFRHTELTSSKYITAFSDFPPPDHYPQFMLHGQYLEYLLNYAHAFQLEQYIQFHATVRSIQRQELGWTVRIDCTDGQKSYECESVAVCTGLNEKQYLPPLESIRGFKGNIIHSSLYKDSRQFLDQNVVIVGGGESGGDILDEISKVAKTTTLSLRRGAFIMPKIDPRMSLPADYFHHRSTYHLPESIYAPIEMGFQNLLDFMSHHMDSWQLRRRLIKISGGSYHEQFLTKSDVFCEALTRRNVSLKPAIRRVESDRVFFLDNTSVSVDSIIFCTGFKVHFPFLPIDSSRWDWRQTYKKMFHPELPGVGFVGFARPHIGAIPPVTELQARYFAGVSSGRLSLPSSTVMKSEIVRDCRITALRKPVVCSRITSIVSWVPYMYELADLIGCRPVLRRLIRRPRVLWSVLFGTVAPPHFRLDGPHAKSGALDVIEREGLHAQNLRTPTDKILFSLLQLVWGLGCVVGYPLFKVLSFLPGLQRLRPEVDF